MTPVLSPLPEDLADYVMSFESKNVQLIVQYVVEGHSYQEIADALQMSRSGVLYHVMKLKLRMGIADTNNAVALAIRFAQMAPRCKDNERAAEALKSLTARQKVVVSLVLGNFSVAQIAQIMNSNNHSVRLHMCRVFDRVGVNSVLELVSWYIAHFGVRPPPYAALSTSTKTFL